MTFVITLYMYIKLYFGSVELPCHSSVLQAAWDPDIDSTAADLFGNVCHHHSEV